MPMQPRPRAETSRLLFPSLRVCKVCVCIVGIVSSFRILSVVLRLGPIHPVYDFAVFLFLNGDREVKGFTTGDTGVPQSSQGKSWTHEGSICQTHSTRCNHHI